MHWACFEIRNEVLGPHHPDTIKSIEHLGSALFALGNYTEALKQFDKAFDLGSEMFDPWHPRMAHILVCFLCKLPGRVRPVIDFLYSHENRAPLARTLETEESYLYICMYQRSQWASPRDVFTHTLNDCEHYVLSSTVSLLYCDSVRTPGRYFDRATQQMPSRLTSAVCFSTRSYEATVFCA